MRIRSALPAEIDQIAVLWHDGWHEAHARLVPPELTGLRTIERFRARLVEALPEIRVAGPALAPTGFAIVKGDELYQLYVSAASRGGGVASALLADAEARLAGWGARTAWLACAIGNDRAARFYEKHGWSRAGTMIDKLDPSTGGMELEVWRYEKRLEGHSARRKV